MCQICICLISSIQLTTVFCSYDLNQIIDKEYLILPMTEHFSEERQLSTQLSC